MTTPTTTVRVPGYVQVSKWIWLIGTAIAVIGALISIALAASAFAWIALVITLVQAAFAIPAALALPQRKRWARTVLLVLALLSLGSLYSALKAGAWPTLILNVALASTFGFLQDPSAREFFDLPREQWLNRKLRRSCR